MQQSVVLNGVTKEDIQQIIKDALDNFKGIKPRVIFLDGSYLYTFAIADVPFVNRFTSQIHTGEIDVMEEGRMVRRNPLAVLWHQWLERFCMGQSVEIYGKLIKPLKIVRSLDRVPNPCLEKVARSFAGQDFNTMAFASIGDGATAGTNPSPSDQVLFHEVSRINVLSEDNGGDLSSDGNTFYSVAAFDVATETSNSPGFTESGIFDKDTMPVGSTIVPTMGDHSIFDDAVPHVSGSDAPGVTCFIYTCGS